MLQHRFSTLLDIDELIRKRSSQSIYTRFSTLLDIDELIHLLFSLEGLQCFSTLLDIDELILRYARNEVIDAVLVLCWILMNLYLFSVGASFHVF